MYFFQHYREVYERLEFVHKKVFPDAHRRRWKQADWTDESDQLILILQSLIHNSAMVNMYHINHVKCPRVIPVYKRDGGRFTA